MEGFFICPVDLTLSVIGGRWQDLIMWNLRNESQRFSKLQKTLVTINDKILSQVLKKLEKQEVVPRKPFESSPPKVEYSLTEKGRNLLSIFRLMNSCGKEYSLK